MYLYTQPIYTHTLMLFILKYKYIHIYRIINSAFVKIIITTISYLRG